MSRQRIIAKLRKNWCFIECTKILDDLELGYEVCPPTGKGHPFILIFVPGADAIRHHVACTPKARDTGRKTVADLRKKLIRAGLME